MNVNNKEQMFSMNNNICKGYSRHNQLPKKIDHPRFSGPNVKHDHGPIRVLKGPQGTTHSMVPLRDQDLDPKSRVQNVVPE